MKQWEIPVVWTMMGTIKVEAETLAEAIEIARDERGEIPIPRMNDDKTNILISNGKFERWKIS